jgi:hypothetical protein
LKPGNFKSTAAKRPKEHKKGGRKISRKALFTNHLFCNKLSSISLDGIGGKGKEIPENRPGGKIRAGSE